MYIYIYMYMYMYMYMCIYTYDYVILSCILYLVSVNLYILHLHLRPVTLYIYIYMCVFIIYTVYLSVCLLRLEVWACMLGVQGIAYWMMSGGQWQVLDESRTVQVPGKVLMLSDCWGQAWSGYDPLNEERVGLS